MNVIAGSFWKSSYFFGFCHSTKIEECFLPLNLLEINTCTAIFNFPAIKPPDDMKKASFYSLAVCLRPH